MPTRTSTPARGGVGRGSVPRSATRGPVSLGSMRVEAVLKVWSIALGPTVPERLFSGYEGV
jgi:hypothetical protein